MHLARGEGAAGDDGETAIHGTVVKTGGHEGADHGEDDQANQAGEIYVRGPQVSGEYKERSALDAEGWFPTRDAGEKDDDGFLFVTGRADDVIVRGGENISPSEIEDVLLEHAAIADAAAVAVPSDEWGETVGIAVVLKPGGETNVHELQHLIKSTLRSSRVPEHVLFVEDELPYNEMGKLLRREIKLLFQYFDSITTVSFVGTVA